MQVSEEHVQRIQGSLASQKYTTGRTHHFYHYPARFSPDVASSVIEAFSQPGEWVLDPFVGGGTSTIEGLVLGRKMVGVDVSSLACFVTKVRTSPLSEADKEAIRGWATLCAYELPTVRDEPDAERVRNLPSAVATFMAGALRLAEGRFLPRQFAFARCALLRLGQLYLDCRDFSAPRRARLAKQLPGLVEEMLDGMDSFVADCRAAGIPKHSITGRRMVLHRSAVGLETDPGLRQLGISPRLVFTSPPYPNVHVLYHRWQYRGRKETAAPFWIADVLDGAGEMFYTGGSRTPKGLRNYFELVTNAFQSIREVIHPNGVLVQLIGFSRSTEQLPVYLDAMRRAGFRRSDVIPSEALTRRVPNRKWYARLKGAVDASSEVLLIHHPT